jgi:hypothetical protein
MPKIPFKNFNMGGIADSDYLGAAHSMADLWGFDIHSEVGVLKVNQALTKESGSTVDDFVKASVPCSDGNTYLFGSTNGKIWKRTSGGTYSLEATASPAAGSAGILDAKEYQGYIYYAMQSRLGRWQIGTAWSTRNDSWATFTKTDASWHPMLILNLVLYIGDANLVAQVDAGVFSANALDISAPLRIKCLGQLGTDLLMGTFVASNIVATEVYRWNTWSLSFTNSDPIPEVGINSFLPIDNNVIVNAGTKGNMYLYNGVTLEPYKTIKGTWDNSTNTGYVHPNAGLNFNGLPLFGLSTLSGSPANMGLYSLGRANRNYPIVLNGEQGISTGNLNNVEIGCIVSVGNIYLVSWKDTNSGTVYGVDKLDLSLKYSGAYLATRVIMVDRYSSLTYGTVNIAYRTLPTGTTFTISKKINSAAYGAIAAGDCKKDTDRNIFYTDVDLGDASTMQVKIAPSVSSNDAPEIEMFEVAISSAGVEES